MKKTVILISGRGSNMAAVADAGINGMEIAAVISSRADALGLIEAQQRGIRTETVARNAYSDKADFEAVLLASVDACSPDLVVLAGFMCVLSDDFCRHYQGRMINVHPSLLPAFPGLHTHRQALARGCKFAGCTVHYVTPEVDGGPIVAQATVEIADDETEESLAEKVLEQEHRLLPQAVADILAGRLEIEGLRVLRKNTR